MIVFALIPVVNFAVGMTGLLGLKLGILAVTRKGKPKGQGVTGIILSSVAMLLAAVLAFVYSMMLQRFWVAQ